MSDILRVVTDGGMLTEQREKLGLSQEEVAAKAGVTLKQYQSYEKMEFGFSSKPMRIVNAVLTALELDPSSYANAEYALKPLPEDDPMVQICKQIK